MSWANEHLKWLKDTGKRLISQDGKTIEVWKLCHEPDDILLSAWAKHFRNHYCRDDEIDFFRAGYGYSRAEYLRTIKFPDQSDAPGPSIRAGDFGEILVADFLEHVHAFWVPRTRYADKDIRNESTKGSDIIGFKFLGDGKDTVQDTLAIFEAKAQFSSSSSDSRLQTAIDGSRKDQIRKGESLNAIKQRLYYQKQEDEARLIDRFQNPEDRPYTEISGAVALLSTSCFDSDIISKADTSAHPNAGNLMLLVIYGDDMMQLVHQLYERAANEA